MARAAPPPEEMEIPTVLGSVRVQDLRRVLVHEHIASAYGGWGRLRESPNLEWEQAILEHYTPLLGRLIGDYDCNAIVESTPGWACRGERDLGILAELSRRTGVHIILATGFFFTHWFHDRRPESFDDMTVAEIAAGMISDIRDGVGSSGVRAGIIKVSVNRFDAADVKLLRAVAIAQRRTGVCISTCAGNGARYLDVFAGAGVSPDRVLLGHGDAGGTLVQVLGLLDRGASTVFTIWGIENPQLIGWPHAYPPPAHYSATLAAGIVSEGFGDRLFLSIDYSAMDGFAGERLVEDLYEVQGRTFLYLFERVLPDLRRFGVSNEAIERMLRDNPRRLLSPAPAA